MRAAWQLHLLSLTLQVVFLLLQAALSNSTLQFEQNDTVGFLSRLRAHTVPFPQVAVNSGEGIREETVKTSAFASTSQPKTQCKHQHFHIVVT